MVDFVETRSRQITYKTGQGRVEYPFGFGIIDPTHIHVWQDGVELTINQGFIS